MSFPVKKKKESLLRKPITDWRTKEYMRKVNKSQRYHKDLKNCNKMKKYSRTVKLDRKFKCKKKCCDIKISPFKWTEEWVKDKNTSEYKAGVFIHDSTTKRILLVQSCGFLWGSPKGGILKTETIAQGAVREVLEETGLNIDIKQLENQTPMYIKKKSYYYIIDMKEKDVSVQKTPNNDANGITWIHVNCLSSLINKRGEYRITKHAKVLIEKVYGIKLMNRART